MGKAHSVDLGEPVYGDVALRKSRRGAAGAAHDEDGVARTGDSGARGTREKDAERFVQRNGYEIRFGDPGGHRRVAHPKLRKGSYPSVSLLEPRRLAEKGLTAVVQEAYIQGISLRSVDNLVKARG